MSSTTDRDPQGRFLIGPDLYDAWWRLLLAVCAITASIVGATVVAASAGSGGTPGETLWAGLVAIVATAIQCAFWVTLVVAGIEWFASGHPVMTSETLPKGSKARSAKGDQRALVAAVATSGVTVFLLVWQQVASPFRADGTSVPILDPALWVPWLALVVALPIVNAVIAVRVYAVGWTGPLATVNAIRAAAFAVILAPPLFSDRLVNPQLVEPRGWGGGTATVSLIIALGVIAVALWEAGNGFVRGRR